MRPTRRPAAAVCALLLAGVLGACGDDEAGVGTDGADAADGQDTVEAFCEQQAAAQEAGDALEPETGEDLPAAIRELADTFDALPRPEEVADDLDAVVEGFRELADQTEEAGDLGQVDLSQFDQVQEASDRLDAFVAENCEV